MKKYKMAIGYEGGKYRGWQRLKNTDQTIQGKIEGVLSKHFGENIEIQGSGRTDAGVHAACQIADFLTEKAVDCDVLRSTMNKFLPDDIVIFSIEPVEIRFHSRFSAVEKTYQYRIWKADYPPVFQRRLVYVNEGEKLDVTKMKKASSAFIGKHDFKAFSSDKTKKSTVRNLSTITFEETDEEIIINLTADGFLYNMVRIIVGTLIEVGNGSRSEKGLENLFDGKVRMETGFTAPAQGLCLMNVKY
ncbi:MAG: tRNA pseudouridine(38-40) synthase TruA [Clostridiales bacterium]|nr:tRNA pseudouridine(38-40) synthase TruA [Clostridiales bacterium]